TGGHRPPRGATPPPQVGARTQPVMAQPLAPGATIQTGPVAVPPPLPEKKSKLVPMLIAAVVVLALGGYGLSRMLGAKADAADAAAAAAAAATTAAAAT